ncbi:15208_t:CDS:2 [Funneliformis geosporum]|nr:15208_t:CDS:2 [Funneliformis geosporum]
MKWLNKTVPKKISFVFINIIKFVVKLFIPDSPPLVPLDEHCEVVISVGYPSRGKSTLAVK